MKIKRVLDEQDIKKIISKCFYVEPEIVKINVKKRSEGYGPGEHNVDYVEIEINEDHEYGGRKPILGESLSTNLGKPLDYSGNV